jgi:hypothetical protein
MSYYTPYNKTITWPANKINHAPAVNNLQFQQHDDLYYPGKNEEKKDNIIPANSHWGSRIYPGSGSFLSHRKRPPIPAPAPDTRLIHYMNPLTTDPLRVVKMYICNKTVEPPTNLLLMYMIPN